MISRRELLKGMVLTAAGLLVPEQVVKVFYSIPKVVVPQNLSILSNYDAILKEFYLPAIKELLNTKPLLHDMFIVRRNM